MARRGNIGKRRKEGMMAIFAKCEDMIAHTFTMTKNKDRFPKSVTFTLSNRIQDKAVNIYEYLLEANEIYPENARDYELRRRLHQKAITNCEQMMFLIELSMTQAQVSYKSAFYWGGLVLDVKYMAVSWMRKDEKRFNFK